MLVKYLWSPTEGDPNDKSGDPPPDNTPDTASDDTTDTDDSEVEDTDLDTESEDSDTDADDVDTTDSDDPDSWEESSDIAKQYFTDPASVPKELRGEFKRMQGQFTRKMQAIQGDLEAANTLKELITIPEFHEWIEAYKSGNLHKRPKSSVREDEDEDDTEDDDAPLTRKEFRKLMNKQSEASARERQEKEANARREAMIRQMAEDADRFKKSHPDYVIYREDMELIMKRSPGISYDDAYELAKTRSAKAKSRREELVRKKKMKSSKPNRVGGGEPEKKLGPVKNIWEALERAKKQLAKKG